ncbi:MAG: ATP-dependent DNA helicase RecG [Oscillospiraceae bacterium]|nr:ATP-dependent DNA helicase RecG [Oscillospiraceae bacterium]
MNEQNLTPQGDTFNSPLSTINCRRLSLYERLGVFTVGDLLTFYPRDYIDYTAVQKIACAPIGEYAVIRAVADKKLKPYIGSKTNLYKLIFTDDSGELLCNIWGNEYSFRALLVGKEYLLYGKIEGSELGREMANPLYITVDAQHKIIPKYRLTKGLTNNMVVIDMRDALEFYGGLNFLDEPLSDDVMKEHALITRADALRLIHFPENAESIKSARKRLIFEELLVLQLGLLQLRRVKRKTSAFIFSDEELDEAFYRSLNFTPTNAQKRAIDECINDMRGMSGDSPMNRLLQGDVGSGKTLVCAAACFFAAKNGCQAAVMAPTEILAKQHYKTFENMLSPLGLRVVLLTGGAKTALKKATLTEISEGQADVIIGTQALIQSAVEFHNLGLVVTDEQHRFGVGQRGMLAKKGKSPHLLVMSATPIPRTLALIIYGDLDLSVLDEMPKGRVPIRTYCVNSSYRERIYKFIIKNIEQGHRAFIVCPLIDEQSARSAKVLKASAVKYYENLKNEWFSDISIGLLHGRMKEKDKNAVMEDFIVGKTSLLVTTTVIEVGIDIPSANIIVIENAEQFGLSQLHQLRGRVGRSDIESHCILINDSHSTYTKERTDIMVRTGDGFEIASEDLKLRGPGDFFGSKQHGLPPLKIADMSKDIEIVTQSKTAADKIFKADPTLKKDENKALKELVKELFKSGEENGFN